MQISHELINTFITILIFPAINYLIKTQERKSAEYARSRDEFNLILLEGLDTIGALARKSALTVHDNNKDLSEREKAKLEDVLNDYENFKKKADEFTRLKTQSAIGMR